MKKKILNIVMGLGLKYINFWNKYILNTRGVIMITLFMLLLGFTEYVIRYGF